MFIARGWYIYSLFILYFIFFAIILISLYINYEKRCLINLLQNQLSRKENQKKFVLLCLLFF